VLIFAQACAPFTGIEGEVSVIRVE